MSITNPNSLEQCKELPDRLFGVAKKRTRLPVLRAFGKRLKELRGKRSRAALCLRLEKQFDVVLNESTYFQYEAGTVWAPDVGVLYGLARLHDVPFGELVTLLLANRKQPDAESWSDLLRHQGDEQRGDAHGPRFSAREFDAMRERLAHCEAALGKVSDLAIELARIARDAQQAS